MKQLTIIFLLFFTNSIFSQDKYILEKPIVDERVELLSIVFRLAGAKEYSSKIFRLYTDKIDKHFSKYKNHELIEFIKKIKKEDPISHDAVMFMAIHIGNPPDFKPLVEFSDSIPDPDQRWKKKNSIKFLELLKKFYKDANCSLFFKNNEDLYKQVSTKFLPIYNYLDLAWYTKFYGAKPKAKFKIVIGLGNGGGNFGPQIKLKNGQVEIYAIMGTWQVDSLGMAKFGINKYFSTLLHEFNHSFVNHLIKQNAEKFQENGEYIYEVVKYEMLDQAYADWNTMLSEALVRASVIKYMKDHNFKKNEIDKEIQDQIESKFLWINELVEELEKYDRQRDKYPTLESYMPNIIEAYNSYTNKIKIYEASLDEKRPKVISINEFNNNDQNVNSEIKTITINFDRPLMGDRYSISAGSKGDSAYPEMGDIIFSQDNKTLILHVKLEKNKEYQFILSGRALISTEKIPIKEYEINFKTE